MPWKTIILATALAWLPAIAFAQAPVADPAEPALPPGVPVEAVFAALEDAQAIDAAQPGQARWTRYLFLQSGDTTARRALGTAVNSVVYRSAIVLPCQTVNPYVVRLDLFEGRADLKVWEKLAPATVFHLQTALQLDECPEYTAADGKKYRHRWVQKIKPSPAVLPHFAALADLCGSQCPIVEAGYFVVRSLSAVDHGFGPGLYYEFIGIRQSTEKGVTDQDLFLRDFFGVDLGKIRGRLQNARTAILISGITKKTRVVEVVQGSGHVRTSDGLVYVSHDLFDDDRSVRRDPFRQLISFVDQNNDRAREIIFPHPNGHPLGALFDSAGKLQVEVPPNIARWDGIPAGHTDRLVAGIACMECHARTETESGLKTMGNDVLTLYRAGKGPLIDLSDPDRDRLKSEYGGDLDETIASSRRFYSTAVFRSSGGLKPQAAYQALFELWSGLLYQDVTPQVACFRLGFAVDDAAAKPLLARIVSQMRVSDPYAELLALDRPIGVRDWTNIEADMLVLAEAMRKDLK